MPEVLLQRAIASVPPGDWAVGVSGGADSVALLMLLLSREDVQLHVVHLDHETRGDASRGDADFTRALAATLHLPCTVATRSEIEPAVAELPANPSARYRRLRMALFERVVRDERLCGVLLAHHAGDRAETTFHRLLRGGSFAGLAAMRRETTVGGLRIVRPFIDVRSEMLRRYLRSIGQGWREDASNASDAYLRNRIRPLLREHPDVSEAMLGLAGACGGLRDWVRGAAPELPARFPMRQVRGLSALMLAESLRRWLVQRGVPADELSPAVVSRLAGMATDAAAPSRQDFPGRVRVRRSRGEIFAETGD